MLQHAEHVSGGIKRVNASGNGAAAALNGKAVPDSREGSASIGGGSDASTAQSRTGADASARAADRAVESHSICHIRYHTEYSGSAVKWGDGHMKVRFAGLALRYDPENVGNLNSFQKSSFRVLQHAVLWTAATVCQR